MIALAGSYRGTQRALTIPVTKVAIIPTEGPVLSAAVTGEPMLLVQTMIAALSYGYLALIIVSVRVEFAKPEWRDRRELRRGPNSLGSVS